MTPTQNRSALSRRGFVALLVLIACVQLLLMPAFGAAKQGYFIDEYYSYGIANDENGHNLPVPDNAWTDPQEFVERLAVSPQQPDDAFNYARIYNNLRGDMAPPLYYFLLHTLCSLVPGLFSKWVGILLNVPFLLGCLALVGCIAWDITRSRAAVLLACFVYALNPGTMTNAVLIRMYAMVSCFILLAVALHLWAVSGRISFPVFLAGCAVCCFLGFLVQYYFIIFMAFLALCAFGFLLYRKQWRRALAYAGTLLGTLALTYVVFPFWLTSMLRTGGGKAATALTRQLSWYTNGTNVLLLSGGVWLLAAAAVGAVVYGVLRVRKSGSERALCALSPAVWKLLALGVSTGLAFCVIAKISDITERLFTMRYMLPLFAPLLLVLVLGLYGLVRRCGALRCTAAALAVGALFTGMNLVGLTNGKSVEFLFPWDKALVAAAREQHDTPVMVLHDTSLFIGMTNQLLQYKRVFFVPGWGPKPITDPELTTSGEVLVYIETYLNSDVTDWTQYVFDNLPQLHTVEKLPSPVYQYELYRFAARD